MSMWKLSYGNGRKSIQVDVSGFCLPRNVCCDYMVGMPKLGPYSKRRELVAHVGGFPSTTQMLQIDQACALQLRLALINKDADKIGAMTERNQSERAQTLHDYLAARSAQAPAAA